MPRPRSIVLCALLVLTSACGNDDDGGEGDDAQPRPSVPVATTAAPVQSSDVPATAPANTAPPPSEADFDSVRVRFTNIATLDQPVALAVRRGDDALYVAEKTGRVRALRGGSAEAVLDLSDQVSDGFEQGLLGLAFAPEGELLYVNYTDTNGDTRVVEFAFSGGRADPSRRRELLFVEQPFANHNGGNLAFGPDGYLWIGLGDGGSGNDPEGNAQSLDTLLGKMLRIDPRPSGTSPYAVPPDNPFLDQAGARPEIWAYGLRNPWRYSFDRATGDLWIADVGQSAREEIDFQPAGSRGGENYGWDHLEGTQPVEGSPPPGTVPPLFEYTRSGGNCSVTGGYVYRGSRLPGLAGAYLFADFCVGQLRALRQSDGEVQGERRLGPAVENLSSFGEDAAGELYALSLDGGVFRIDPA